MGQGSGSGGRFSCSAATSHALSTSGARASAWLGIAAAAMAACGDAAPPAVKTTVTLTLARGPQPANAEWAAYRDHTGPWRPAVGTQGRYDLTVTGPTYAVALACDDAVGPPRLVILRRTLQDEPSFKAECPSATRLDTASIGVELDVILGTVYYRLSVGNERGWQSAAAGGHTHRYFVAPGTYDLALSFLGGAGVERVVLRRDVTVPPDYLATFEDLRSSNLPAGVLLTDDEYPLRVSGPASDLPGLVGATVEYWTQRWTAVPLDTYELSPGERFYRGLGPPPEDRSDLYSFAASRRSSGWTLSARTFTRIAGPAQVFLPDPPAWKPQLITTNASGKTTITVRWPAALDFDRVTLALTGRPSSVEWNYRSTASAHDGTFEVPTLSGLPGWQTRWDLGPAVDCALLLERGSRSAADRARLFSMPVIPPELEGVELQSVSTACER